MRMRRTHEHRIGLVRLRRVLDEAPAPLNERIILDARLEMMIVLASCLIHARPPFGQPVIARDHATSMGQTKLPRRFHIWKGYSGTTAVASISIFAAGSTSPPTWTTAIAGK